MRDRRLRTLALFTCLLSVLVVGVSAYLRLAGAGLGCADWPDCYGRVLAGGQPMPWEGARLVHRIVATLTLLAGILLAWRSWRPQPLQPAARHAALLLALMLFLSVVGVWSSDPRMALVNFINLVGGLGLVTFSWRGGVNAVPSQSAQAIPPGRLFPLGMATPTMTGLLGGLIGARHAGRGRGTPPDCLGAWWPAADGWSALNPVVMLAGPAEPGGAGGVTLHLLHRYGAMLAAVLLVAIALRLRAVPRGRNAALAVLTLLLLEGLIGVLTVASGFSLWLAVAHNVGAALLLAAAASLMHSVRQ